MLLPGPGSPLTQLVCSGRGGKKSSTASHSQNWEHFLKQDLERARPRGFAASQEAVPPCSESSTWRPAHVPSRGSSQRAPSCGTAHKQTQTWVLAEMCIPAAGGPRHYLLGEVLHPSITALPKNTC